MANTNAPQKAIVPPQLETEMESLTFIKRLLATSVSAVTYSRRIFPPDCYTDRELCDGRMIKILSSGGEEDNERAIRLLQLLHGSFDAIDKGYLRAFIFGIACDPRKPEIVSETYEFKIDYNQEENLPDGEEYPSYDETTQSMIQVLQKLAYMVSKLGPVAEGSFITVKLLYYDQCTPSDYEPAGFVPSKTPHFHFSSTCRVEATSGKVATKFHSVELRLRAKFFLDADE